MSGYFISAIGTGVGKTFATAALAWQLRQAGKPVRALKPIVSGFGIGPCDVATLMEATGQQDIDDVSHWRFAAPLSPHLAAAKEGRQIAPFELIQWCQQRISSDETTLIEGVGGICVPLCENYQVLDWMQALNLPVILVSSSYLGAINHTLLSLQALRQAGVVLHALVVSEAEAHCDAGLKDTCDTLVAYLPEGVPLVAIERVQTCDSPWQSTPSLLSLIV